MALSDAHFVDSDKATGTGGTWTSTGQSRIIKYPLSYSHLNGEKVKVVKAGVILADQTVVAGVVSGTPDHAGLSYTSIAKPMKLDIEGMGITLTKKITKAIVSFYQTLKGKVGTSPTTMQKVAFGTTLFDGIKEVPMNDGYDRSGDIIVVQDEPMPMVCRGLILETGAYNAI